MFQIYVIDSSDRKRFEETGEVRINTVFLLVTHMKKLPYSTNIIDGYIIIVI